MNGFVKLVAAGGLLLATPALAQSGSGTATGGGGSGRAGSSLGPTSGAAADPAGGKGATTYQAPQTSANGPAAKDNSTQPSSSGGGNAGSMNGTDTPGAGMSE